MGRSAISKREPAKEVMSDKPEADAGMPFPLRIVVTSLLSIGILMFMFDGGLTAMRKYLRTKSSSEKLSNLRYHGDWAVAEYRECNSTNLREEDGTPQLECPGSSPMNHPSRLFKIEFFGDLTYDPEKPEGAVHYWLRRRNDGDPAFSCKQQPGKVQVVP